MIAAHPQNTYKVYDSHNISAKVYYRTAMSQYVSSWVDVPQVL